MEKIWGKGLSVLLLSLLFITGCQSAGENSSEEGANAKEEHNHSHEVEIGDAPEKIKVEGVSDHYHTGDLIKLTAELEEDSEFDHWHWYTRNSSDDEWEAVPELDDNKFFGDAETNGQQIIAVMFNDDHEPYAQSEVIEVVIDDHGHGHSHAHDEESQQIYDGYFEDEQVEDRTLGDWEGDWQSVYPLHQNGTLDEVYAHKAEESDDMTAEEYKAYYETGYVTDVHRIVIDGNEVTFFEEEEEKTGEYQYDGYEILNYEAGNRGVRFIFKLEEETEGLPTYIQFSDHSIFPTDSGHYHLYWGDDRQALLEEVEHWPTYYPSEMSEEDIVHEMIAH